MDCLNLNIERLQDLTSPHDIFAKPENTFVAGFIGTPQMNIADCNVNETNSSEIEISLLKQKITLKFKNLDHLIFDCLKYGAKKNSSIFPPLSLTLLLIQ